MVDLGGYVIVLVEKDGKIKLFGSAAERNDCDEILEINGSSPERMSHEEIIKHIHQCIKTRTICLRVKRRSSGKLGSSIDSSLIDAFVIGSRAREHLQTITKDANITPKDIAQLSKILSENSEIDIKQPEKQRLNLENKENSIRTNDKKQFQDEKSNLRKSDSGDIDYLELNDDNMQLLNINPGPNITLKKTDSQQSIVDLVKRSASISLSNASLNKITYNSNKLDDEESKKYIPFNRLNSVVNRLEESLNDGNLSRLIKKTNFKNLIDIYSTLMQERYLNASFIDLNSVQLHQEVIELLQNKGNVEDDFIELLEILNKFEYEGLFQVLNHILEKQKKLSAQDDLNVQEEMNDRFEDNEEESIKETENIFEDNAEVNDSLIEESVSLKESEKTGYEKESDDEKKIDAEKEAESKKRELNQEFEIEQSKDDLIRNEDSKQIEQPPAVPPLPLQIINSLSLDIDLNRQKGSANLITTTAEIPSLSSLASAIYPISSTKQISSNQFTSTSDQVLFTPSNIGTHHQPSIPQQNILQNTFINTVNDSLNFVNSSNLVDLSQTPYCNLQQSSIQPKLVYNLSPTPLSCTIPILDKQSSIHQTNLCNLSSTTDTPIVNANLHILNSFDLPLNNFVQLNDLAQIPSQNQSNLPNSQNIQQQSNQTISALDYANGQVPPAPEPPLVTTLPPNLNNLPANLPPNTKLSIVRIEKHSSEPLGATVRNEHDGRVTIGRILCGGAASKCSAALQEGDEILMVNNVYIRGKTVDQVCELLSQMQGTLTFVIAKSCSKADHQSKTTDQAKLNINNNVQRKSSTSSHDSNNFPNCKVIHYKAFFDYNPLQDIYIPCKELGVSFRKGDLLHVIDSSDEHWWQAFKEGDLNQNLAGLIPSLKFQLMREEVAKKLEQQNEKQRQEEQIELDSLDSSINKRTTSSILSFNCSGKRSSSKKRKNRKEEEFIASDYYMPYEEMKQVMGLKRTVILVGPNNIGRQNLRERLVKIKSLYGTAIPHTSRVRRTDERNGEDYYFVSKQQFEQFIEENKFVEYGDYDKNYYGTSFGSIEDVLKSNKTCILNLHVQSILKLRTPSAGKKFKPFFVFIAPPTNLDVLRKLVESINNMPVSLNELHSILNEAYVIRKHFAHYFDLILTVTDLEETFKLLLNEINSLDKEPQWINSIWL